MERLKKAAVNILVSHGELTSREYNKDPSYNNQSLGYREEEELLSCLIEIYGDEELIEKVEQRKKELIKDGVIKESRL